MDSSVFQTIFAGVTVFVLGQFIIKLILEPLVKFREGLGEVSALFLRHQAKITNANGDDEISRLIKEAGSQLIARKQAIPLYWAVRQIFWLPSGQELLRGCRGMNFIATTCSLVEKPANAAQQITQEMTQVEKSLGIVISYQG